MRLQTTLPILIFIALAALLWLPFGFNIGFSGDEWYLFYHSSFTPIWGQPSRPLLALPNYAAYLLSPQQFWGFNLMLALATALRGVLAFALLRALGAPHVLAFGVGALALIFPADLGVYYLGALQVYYSSVFFMLAALMLLTFARRRRALPLLAMIIFQMACLGMYEAAYPLIVITPALLLIKRPRLDRLFWSAAGIWYLVPALNLVRYALLLAARPDTFAYQQSLVNESTFTLSGMIEGLIGILQRHFISGWLPGTFDGASELLPYALIAGALVFAGALWLAHTQMPTYSPRLLIALAGAGAVVLLLSIAIYLPTSARADHLRTYYTSVIGAAMILCALLLAFRRPLILAAGVGILTTVGSVRLLEQGRDYAAYSEVQQSFLLNTLALVPDLDAWTGIIIIDESTDNRVSRLFGGYWSLQTPFLVAYDDPTHVVTICLSTEGSANEFASCTFDSEGVLVESPPNPSWRRGYDQLVMFRYSADGSLSLIESLPDRPTYAPRALIPPDAQPSPRALRMFGADES